jgi:hypothetical protein
MSTPSEIKMTPALQAKIAACKTTEEMQEFLHQASIDQGIAVRSIDDPNQLLSVPENERPPATISKTITVNSKTYEISGENETELARAEADCYRQIFAPPAEQPRDESGRFVSSVPARTPEDSARVAELRMQMIRGEISGEEFLLQSGEFQRVQQVQNEQREFNEQNQFRNSWTDATTEFKSNHSDWKGGVELTNRVGEKLIELELSDNPSAESLESAWAAIQAEDSEAATTEKLANAQSPDAVLEALGRNKYSGMFGR